MLLHKAMRNLLPLLKEATGFGPGFMLIIFFPFSLPASRHVFGFGKI